MASINLRTFQGNVGNLRDVKSVKTIKAEQLAEKEDLKGKTTVQDLSSADQPQEPQVNKYKKPTGKPHFNYDFCTTYENGEWVKWLGILHDDGTFTWVFVEAADEQNRTFAL